MITLISLTKMSNDGTHCFRHKPRILFLHFSQENTAILSHCLQIKADSTTPAQLLARIQCSETGKKIFQDFFLIKAQLKFLVG